MSKILQKHTPSKTIQRYFLFQAIKTEATGLYSRKAFERLGFQAVSEVLYSQYQAETGELIFENIRSHRGTTFMIKHNIEVGILLFIKILYQITF